KCGRVKIGRAKFRRLSGCGPLETWTIRLLDGIGLGVNGWRLTTCKSGAPAGVRWRALAAKHLATKHLATKHALKEREGLGELARARQACDFAYCVLVQQRHHRVLSQRAALTAGLACSAPSTETEAIVARASSGVTSGAIVARPRTLMCNISPARRAASRSSRL